jgi:hypothetical protein
VFRPPREPRNSDLGLYGDEFFESVFTAQVAILLSAELVRKPVPGQVIKTPLLLRSATLRWNQIFLLDRRTSQNVWKGLQIQRLLAHMLARASRATLLTKFRSQLPLRSASVHDHKIRVRTRQTRYLAVSRLFSQSFQPIFTNLQLRSRLHPDNIKDFLPSICPVMAEQSFHRIPTADFQKASGLTNKA